MNPGNLIDELKRRRVLRVAGVYIVVAWIAIQGAATIFPILELPGWTTKLVVILVALGFPMAVTLAWAFDLRRDTAPEGVQAVPTRGRPGAGIAYFGIGILVALVGYGLSSRYLLPEERGEAEREHSVVVLPFQNMSSDQEQEFFSDGITEEILNALAKVPGLRVPARTTSFSFKGKNLTVREIAATVGVAHVLEGSVRRAGDRVRITAQLIDARTDQHLWSETYDRDLTDVFAVQEEIARAIADELRLRVIGSAGVHVAQATSDPRAYELYLQGLHEFNRRGEGVETAILRFRQAIARDPKFARAHAALAEALAVSPSYSSAMTREAANVAAREAAQRALALDPNLAGAHAAIAYTYRFDGQLDDALRSFQRAVAADSTYAQAQFWYAMTLAQAGDEEAGLTRLRRAIALDPRSMIFHYNYAVLLTATNQYQEALKEVRVAWGIEPSFAPAQIRLAELLARTGQRDSARAILSTVRVSTSEARRTDRYWVAKVWALLGERERAEQMIAGRPPADGTDHTAVAAVYAVLGDHERTLRHLEQAKEAGDVGEFVIGLRNSRDFDAIRNTPRFQAVLASLSARPPSR